MSRVCPRHLYSIRRVDGSRKLESDREQTHTLHALREYIHERGSVQYLFDLIEKAEQLDPTDPDFDKKLAQMKVVFDQRQKMLDKYMPALKASEISLEANLKATQVDMMGIDTDDIESRHDRVEMAATLWVLTRIVISVDTGQNISHHCTAEGI